MNESHRIADSRAPRPVESQTVLVRGLVVDFCEDQVVVEQGKDPVRRQYTRHPGAVGVVALRGQAPLAVTAEDALRVIYLTELAQQSSDCGRRLTVDAAAV